MVEFEGYEAEDYERIMPHLEGFEGLQATLLGAWLINRLPMTSVVDVGCGSGFYLTPFECAGIIAVGIDAMPQTSARCAKYIQHDLRTPFHSDTWFTLALCLEVAEHLPPEFADTILDTISGLSDVVVFSAATPGQGGEHHHNERPTQYWLDRFAERGYKFHPLNDEFQAWLQMLTPLREKEQVCGWFIDHTFILQKQ
jgi:SAM-dependent methyltransferase